MNPEELGTPVILEDTLPPAKEVVDVKPSEKKKAENPKGGWIMPTTINDIYLQGSGISCGVRTLAPIVNFIRSESEVQKFLSRNFLIWVPKGGTSQRFWKPRAMSRAFGCAVIFADGDVYGNSAWFAQKITENKLGNVVEIPVGMNPNSGHKNTVYVWREFNLKNIYDYVFPILEYDGPEASKEKEK